MRTSLRALWIRLGEVNSVSYCGREPNSHRAGVGRRACPGGFQSMNVPKQTFGLSLALRQRSDRFCRSGVAAATRKAERQLATGPEVTAAIAPQTR